MTADTASEAITQAAEQIVRDRCADWRWPNLEEGLSEHCLAVNAAKAGIIHGRRLASQDAGEGLPTDRYGENALDRMRDHAENGTMPPQFREDLRALLSLALLATPPSDVGSTTRSGGEGAREALNEFCRAAEYTAGCDSDAGVDPEHASSEIWSSMGSPMAVAYDKARKLLTPSPDASPDSGEPCDFYLGDCVRCGKRANKVNQLDPCRCPLPKHPSPEAPANRQEAGKVEVAFEVWQGDELAAASSDEKDGWHYLAVYEQDGPATLVRAETRRTTLTSPKDVKGGGR